MNLKTRNIVLASLILVCFSNIASFSQAGPAIPGEDYYVYTSHPSDQEVLKDTSFTITWRLYTNDVGRYYDLIRISPSGQTYTLRNDWSFVNGQAISYSTRLATPGIHTYKIVADTSHCSPKTDEVKVKVKYSTDDYDGDGLPNEYDENPWVVDEVDEDDTWTVMCYLSADYLGTYYNDEGQYKEYLAALFKSSAISELTDNSNVNFAYLMDGYYENEALVDPDEQYSAQIPGTGNPIYPTVYIEGDDPELSVLEDEWNMGDPNNLSRFIDVAKSRLPSSKNYMLVIQSHGDGVHGSESPEGLFPPNTLGGCSIDSNASDYLTIMEIQEAIKYKGIDILGFDCCFMGATEILYELKDDVKFMIASEQPEPSSNKFGSIESGGYGGWPFKTAFSFLDSHPQVSQEMFCKYVVNAYAEEIDPSREYTMAYMKTSELTDLKNYVQLFCNKLISDTSQYLQPMKDVFQDLKDNTQFISHFSDKYVKTDYIDFKTFLLKVQTQISALAPEVASILEHLSDTIGWYRGPIDEERFHGLSIFLPYDDDDQVYFSNYAQYQWAIDTQWNTFIDIYIGKIISYWKFNGDAADSAGDNHGEVHGASLATDRFGNLNSAYDFDGDYDYISIPDSDSLDCASNSITISAWIFPKQMNANGDGTQMICEKKYAWYFNLQAGTLKPQFYWYDLSNPGYHVANNAIPQDQWSFVSARYDGENDRVRLYINGILDKEVTGVGGTGRIGTEDVHIGGYGGNRDFKGKIEHVKIISTVLSEDETYYMENFDDGADLSGWTCIDYPYAYNFISIVGTTAPFISQSLRIIDSQGGMIVSGQTTIPTPFSTGEIELDFSIREPGLAGYPGEYYLYLYAGSQVVISIKFYAEREEGWSVGITGAGMSGVADFDTSIRNHLNLRLTNGNAELFLDGVSVSTKSFDNVMISQFKIYSTPISIGFIFFDNIIMHN